LPPEAEGLVTATQRVAARVLSTRFSNQKVSIQTDAPADTMLTISQTYYPAWQARIDEMPARLWRANYAFQALQVPGGGHHIELVYRDKSFVTGLVLSGLGLLTCPALWWLAHRRSTRIG